MIIKANTPHEAVSAIVQWLRQQESYHRINAGKAKLAGTKNFEITKSTAYNDAATFINNIQIETKS